VNLISSLSRSYSDLMSKASRKHRISTVFIAKMTLRRSGWRYQRFACGRRLGRFDLPCVAAERSYYSPKGSFLSEPQGSTHSARLSKFDRFELLMSLCGAWFCRFSWTGESLQFLTARSRRGSWLSTSGTPHRAFEASINVPSRKNGFQKVLHNLTSKKYP
jgi:hypothetical protein